MYNYNQLENAVESKGYAFFRGNRNVNLIGVRNNNNLTNKYDCDLYLVQEVNGEKMVIHINEFTTKPGKYYTIDKLLNRRGVAIVVPGQYRGLWFVGKHRKRPALRQKGYLSVYRDNNRDNIFDMIKKTIQRGNHFLINLHDAFGGFFIGRNSAGCQVCRYKRDKDVILKQCKLSAKIYSNSFTYTLLERNDF